MQTKSETHQNESIKANALHSALQYFDQLPNAAHVRQPVVQVILGCSSATVWRWVKFKRIPKPIKLSVRISAWNVGQLRQALAEITADPLNDTPSGQIRKACRAVKPCGGTSEGAPK
jgi:predicted DNA-binding transcriptional regulator AlpA